MVFKILSSSMQTIGTNPDIQGVTWIRLCSVKQFNPDFTFCTGQCFNWKSLGTNKPWYGFIGKHPFGIKINNSHVEYAYLLESALNEADLDILVKDYFQMSHDLEQLYNKWSSCQKMSIAGKCLPGVRVLRQDPWETLISFICSSNNNISRITKTLEILRVKYGTYTCSLVPTTYGKIWKVACQMPTEFKYPSGTVHLHLFPSPHTLAALEESTLREAGVGYRAMFLLQSTKMVINKSKQFKSLNSFHGNDGWLWGLRSPQLHGTMNISGREGETCSEELSEDLDHNITSHNEETDVMCRSSSSAGLNCVKQTESSSSVAESQQSQSLPLLLEAHQQQEQQQQRFDATDVSDDNQDVSCPGTDNVECALSASFSSSSSTFSESPPTMASIAAHVKACLMQLPGVGPKVADCVALFALDQHSVVPVDTHVWDITMRDFAPHLHVPKAKITPIIYQHIGDLFRLRYGDKAGWAHTVLFAAELPIFSHLLPTAILAERQQFKSKTAKPHKGDLQFEITMQIVNASRAAKAIAAAEHAAYMAEHPEEIVKPVEPEVVQQVMAIKPRKLRPPSSSKLALSQSNRSADQTPSHSEEVVIEPHTLNSSQETVIEPSSQNLSQEVEPQILNNSQETVIEPSSQNLSQEIAIEPRRHKHRHKHKHRKEHHNQLHTQYYPNPVPNQDQTLFRVGLDYTGDNMPPQDCDAPSQDSVQYQGQLTFNNIQYQSYYQVGHHSQIQPSENQLGQCHDNAQYHSQPNCDNTQPPTHYQISCGNTVPQAQSQLSLNCVQSQDSGSYGPAPQYPRQLNPESVQSQDPNELGLDHAQSKSQSQSQSQGQSQGQGQGMSQSISGADLTRPDGRAKAKPKKPRLSQESASSCEVIASAPNDVPTRSEEPKKPRKPRTPRVKSKKQEEIEMQIESKFKCAAAAAATSTSNPLDTIQSQHSSQSQQVSTNSITFACLPPSNALLSSHSFEDTDTARQMIAMAYNHLRTNHSSVFGQDHLFS